MTYYSPCGMFAGSGFLLHSLLCEKRGALEPCLSDLTGMSVDVFPGIALFRETCKDILDGVVA